MNSICIVGLGAIGGTVGARLAGIGIDVRAIARGATAAAVAADGLVLEDGERERRVAVRIAERADALGIQECVLLAPKAGAMPDLAPSLVPLIGPATTIVSMMNGVPWWFGHGLSGAPALPPLASVDPGGVVGSALPAAQVVGTVTHLAASSIAPGRVRLTSGNRIIVGAPHAESPDPAPFVAALASAGFDVEHSDRIHRDVWYKLWGNITMNPISALTGATLDRILDDPLVRGFASAVMREVAAIGSAIGLPIDADPEQRHRLTRGLGPVRTSMLQDIEAGKPLEIDAIVAAVREIGIATGQPTANIDTLLGLIRLRARTLGLY